MNNVMQWLEASSNSNTARGRIPVVDNPKRDTDLFYLSATYAAALHGLGVKKGDKVGLFFDSSPGYLTMLLAIWRLNAIAVPLSPKSIRQSRNAKVNAPTASACRIKLLIYSESTNEEVLIQWMQLCNGPVYPLDHFKNLTVPEASYFAAEYYKAVQADDIAVHKLPDDTNIVSDDSVLTHSKLLLLLEQSGVDFSQPLMLALPVFTTSLLSLVTMPLQVKVMSSSLDS